MLLRFVHLRWALHGWYACSQTQVCKVPHSAAEVTNRRRHSAPSAVSPSSQASKNPLRRQPIVSRSQVMMNVDLTPGGVAAGERIVLGGAIYPRASAQQQQQQQQQPVQQASAPQPSDAQQQQYSHPHAVNGTGGPPDAHQPPPQWAADGPKRKAEPYQGGTGYAGGADGGGYHQHGQKHQRIS